MVRSARSEGRASRSDQRGGGGDHGVMVVWVRRVGRGDKDGQAGGGFGVLATCVRGAGRPTVAGRGPRVAGHRWPMRGSAAGWAGKTTGEGGAGAGWAGEEVGRFRGERLGWVERGSGLGRGKRKGKGGPCTDNLFSNFSRFWWVRILNLVLEF